MAEQVEKITGLTSEQVAQQIAKGNQNTSPAPLTHSIKEIFKTNIVTLFNLINVMLGLFVLYTGSYKTYCS